MNVIIPLTKSRVAIVDDHKFDELIKYDWYCTTTGYAARTRSISEVTSKFGRVVLMHRQIIAAPYGAYVDHINGNKLDNRECNLRICTHSQNLANRPAPRTNKFGLKGVTFDKSRGKFIAQITVMYDHKFLGRFETAELAYEAYKKAAWEYFGEFAHNSI